MAAVLTPAAGVRHGVQRERIAFLVMAAIIVVTAIVILIMSAVM